MLCEPKRKKSASGLLLSYHFYLGFRYYVSTLALLEKHLFRQLFTRHSVLQGGIDDGGAASVRAIMHWQYRTICRGPNSILQNLYDIMGPKAHDYISFYGLRTYGKLYDGGPLVTNQVKLLPFFLFPFSFPAY